MSTIAAPPMSMIANIVQLVNEGETTFSMRYGPLDRMTLEPGQSAFVPEEVAWHFVGRWWTDNSNPRDRARKFEIDRLHVLYGAYEDLALWEGTGTNESGVPQPARKPSLAAYTADGRRIVTVIDDPEGTAGGGPQTALGKEQSLEAQVAIMQSTLLSLQAKLDARDRVDADMPDAPADAPTAPAPSAPFNPSQPVATMPNIVVPMPIAPDAFAEPQVPHVIAPTNTPYGVERPVPIVEGAAQVGHVPVGGPASVAYDPRKAALAGATTVGPVEPPSSLDDVPEDAPAKMPVGPGGGTRIPAGPQQQ